MKPAPFDYVRPTSIDEAVAELDRGAGDATVLAGGQSLMPLLALRMSTPSVLIDVNRIAALKGVTYTADGVRIGAMTRQAELIADDRLAAALPPLVQAVRHVGHYQTRNRGTIGGSVSLGEPAAELPACVTALGAEIEVVSVRGTRRIPAADFYIGPYATTVEIDELVVAIHFPEQAAGSVTMFREVARRPGDFALVGIVGSAVIDRGRIAGAGLAWFGMGPTPIRAVQAEAALGGATLDRLDAAGIADLGIADTDPFDDHHATAHYRRTVGKRVLAKLLGELGGARLAA